MEVSWFRCLSRSLPVLTLPDRRTPANRPTKFVFLYDVERVLYGDTGHSTGAVHRLLQRGSLSQTVVSLKRSSVSDGLVTQAEFTQIISTFQETLPMEARGRVRNCSLLPLPVAINAAKSFGRSTQAIAFLESFQSPIPHQWELQEESEANREEGLVDLVLEDELAAIEEAEVRRQIPHRPSMHTLTHMASLATLPLASVGGVASRAAPARRLRGGG